MFLKQILFKAFTGMTAKEFLFFFHFILPGMSGTTLNGFHKPLRGQFYSLSLDQVLVCYNIEPSRLWL